MIPMELGLNAQQPGEWLASIGLLALCPAGSALSFLADGTPQLHLPEGADVRAVSASVHQQLVRLLTVDEDHPYFQADIGGKASRTSTTLPIPHAVLQLERDWASTELLSFSRWINSATVIPDVHPRPDKHAKADLILFSGKAYQGKMLKDLASQSELLTEDLDSLFEGFAPTPVRMGNMFRFSGGRPDDGLAIDGSRTGFLYPLVEALGMVSTLLMGVMQQHEAGRKGFWWVLHPVPLPLETIMAAQKTQTAPHGWSPYAADVVLVDKFHHFEPREALS